MQRQPLAARGGGAGEVEGRRTRDAGLGELQLAAALAQKGLGCDAESGAAIRALESVDPWNIKLSYFRQLNIL